MTAQIPDTLFLRDQTFSLVGVNGSGLFDPYELGLHPIGFATHCWRGYVCEYKVISDKFTLHQLQINLITEEQKGRKSTCTIQEGPPINEVKPVIPTDKHTSFNNIYQDLNLPINFTGGILAARDFIRELYVHMGFHPAWKYKYVFELVISHGYVLETRDVSECMQELRHALIKSPLEPGADATREQLEAWTASTFKLNYNF